MSLYSDLNEVLTPYAQRIKGLAAADEKIKADLDTLADITPIPDNSDLNDYTETGLYSIENTSYTILNYPDSDGTKTAATLEVKALTTGYIQQVMNKGAGRMFARVRFGNGNWQNWHQLTYIKPGLSQQAKAALLACFRHVRWHDDDIDYYATLAEALQGDDLTRPITANVPQVGVRTADQFASLYGTVRDHRGIIVSSNSAAGHTIPYYNESSGAYYTEFPYYPILIPVGAQEYWIDESIENMYAYSTQIVRWNADTEKWDITQAGQFIWTDALVTSDTPHSQLTPYHQDISAFNDGTYYMVIGIGKTIGTTTWKDNEGIRRTFPNGAYLADMDTTVTGIVDTSIANLALRFSF